MAVEIYAEDVQWLSSASFRLQANAKHIQSERLSVYSISALANRFSAEVPELWQLIMHLLDVDSSVEVVNTKTHQSAIGAPAATEAIEMISYYSALLCLWAYDTLETIYGA
jgi:hypothetical protein